MVVGSEPFLKSAERLAVSNTERSSASIPLETASLGTSKQFNSKALLVLGRLLEGAHAERRDEAR